MLKGKSYLIWLLEWKLTHELLGLEECKEILRLIDIIKEAKL